MFRLIPHPAHPSSTVTGIVVLPTRPSADRINLTYRIEGDTAAILWPPKANAEFADELWMHSCCETFVGDGTPNYTELNLAPSTRYAAYDFDGYRKNMRNADGVEVAIRWDESAATLHASATIPRFAHIDRWRLALSVVIEDKSGAKSFWALTHPSPEPDFHNTASFAAALVAPDAAA